MTKFSVWDLIVFKKSYNDAVYKIVSIDEKWLFEIEHLRSWNIYFIQDWYNKFLLIPKDYYNKNINNNQKMINNDNNTVVPVNNSSINEEIQNQISQKFFSSKKNINKIIQLNSLYEESIKNIQDWLLLLWEINKTITRLYSELNNSYKKKDVDKLKKDISNLEDSINLLNTELAKPIGLFISSNLKENKANENKALTFPIVKK